MFLLPKPLDKIDIRNQKIVELPKAKELFHIEQRSTGFFYVVEGAISLCRFSEQGEETILHRARSGETFAEASLFAQVYHCNAYATKDSRLIEISRKSIWGLMEKDKEFSYQLMARFASQVQNHRQRLELLSIKEASKRVYAAIQNGMLKGSIIDFAADINLSHEATYRALGALVRGNKLKKVARGKYRLL